MSLVRAQVGEPILRLLNRSLFYDMTKRTDDDGITLIGGGIMSLTLGVLINEIFPDYPINLVERLGDISLESSSALNNAGTGHAGYCELNYTPQNKNGEINISRAININEMFENSLEDRKSVV